jgi:PAS domain S-box-containing protein
MTSLCFFAARSARRVDFLALERQRVEALYRRTFENAAVGFAHLDRDGRWLRVNDRLCEILGWSRDELLGRPFQEVTHPDDLPLDEELLASFLTGETESERFEKRYLTKQGYPIWAEVTVSAERDEQGRVDYFVAVIQDIGARKRAEIELGLARRALEASSEGVLITDAGQPDEPIVYVNPAFSRITGYGADEALGRNCRFLNEGDREQPGLEEVRRALRSGESAAVVLRNFRKDGSPFWNELRVSPVADGGTVTHHVGIQQDVSARVAAAAEHERLLRESVDARAEAERAGRAKDGFFALVTHELRSPLAGVTGWLAVLRRETEREVRERALDAIERSAALLARLINDLLDASRIASGKLEIEREVLDLAGVVQGAVEALEPFARSRGVALALRGDELPAFVSGDAERLDQVLRNLIENALKFTPAGGRVEVELGRSGPEIEVTVRDTGTGIDPALLPSIFERFSQGAAGPRGAGRGLGLGLSIVRHLVEVHGGGVSAESEGRGRGATFRVTLPAQALPSRLAPMQAAEEPDALEGVRVLILEPERTAAEALALLLEDADARIVWARTPEEALVQMETRPDVFIANLDRLEYDALPIALRARAPAGAPRVAAIALSTVGTPAMRRDAREAGFDAHLEQPVSAARLMAQIHAALSGPKRVLVVDDDRDAADSLAILLARQGFEVERAYDVAGALAVAKSFGPSAVVTDLELGGEDGIGLARALRAGARRPLRIVAATGGDPEELGAEARVFDAVLRKPVDLPALVEGIRGPSPASAEGRL